MRILYGVVGEGMGHATRSRVVIEHLLDRGHEVQIVVSGRAAGFLEQAVGGRPGAHIEEIRGLGLRYDDGGIDLSQSVRHTVSGAPRDLVRNLDSYRALRRGGFRPDVVVSDFESWAYLYGRAHGIPVLSVDNIQALHRCRHPRAVAAGAGGARLLATAAVKLKLPGAYHYVITSFFFPEVRKPRTTLVAPLLRPEILAAHRGPGEHVLVYQTAAGNSALEPLLLRLPYEFRVYGAGREGVVENVHYRPFSQAGFIDDLRTAQGVVATGGFSLMSEAVHLGVPMLAVPVAGQFEQELNARYLAHLGYGAHAPELSLEAASGFLLARERYSEALASYPRQDNTAALSCIERLLVSATSRRAA